MSVTATQVKPEIGVEMTGVHGHEFVDAGVAADCQAALETYGVAIYREANIDDDDDLVAFSHLLGQVHMRPRSTDSMLSLIHI